MKSEQHKKEVIKKCHRAYDQRNKDKQKAYYLKNKEHICLKYKELYILNKDSILLKRKEYYLANKDDIIKQHNKYLCNKYKSDPITAITMRCRSRMYRMLIKGEYNQHRTFDLIGCTPRQLKTHLESKFTPGMNWNNRNKWHIDHIIPCAIFDLSKEDERMRCFHYTNLQPLWMEDNLKKSCKLM